MGCGKSKDKKNEVEDKPEEIPQGPPEKVEDAYIVGKEIGRGGFSIVKEGTDKKSNERVAIKYIEKNEKVDLGLMQREIKVMKSIKHNNILELRDVFDTQTQIQIVTEILGGGELFYKIVQKGNYSEKDAALIMKQVVDGVEYLHSEGFAHRDLKPENLLCSLGPERGYEPFRVVIADFGLSKSFEDGSILVTSCGTPEYVAPEVIEADGNYDKSVDVWSVGVIAYVLLCGFSPFGEASTDPSSLLYKIVKAEYGFPDPEWTEISEQAKDFIRHLIVKDVDQRWNATQAKEHEWLTGKFGTDKPLAGGDIARRITQYHLKSKTQLGIKLN